MYEIFTRALGVQFAGGGVPSSHGILYTSAADNFLGLALEGEGREEGEGKREENREGVTFPLFTKVRMIGEGQLK